MNIKTENQYYGWIAYDDDTYDGEGPVGVAPYPGTEQDAIDDLFDKLDLPYSMKPLQEAS